MRNKKFIIKDNGAFYAPVTGEAKEHQADQIKVKYVRDYLNGSTSNTGNHWCEIEIYDESGINLARGIMPTGNGAATDIGRLTDGNRSYDPYYSADSGEKWIQIELPKVTTLSKIHVWHYHGDTRQYNTKLQISSNGVDWIDVFNSSRQGTYAESASGKAYIMKDIKVVTSMKELNIIPNFDLTEVGMEEHGADLSEIQEALLNSLNILSPIPEILMISGNKSDSGTLVQTGTHKPTVIKTKTGFSLEQINGNNFIKTELKNIGDCKIAISTDNGVSWFSFDKDLKRVDIDITDKDAFFKNGMHGRELKNINKHTLSKVGRGNLVKFAFLLYKQSSTSESSLKSLDISFKLS